MNDPCIDKSVTTKCPEYILSASAKQKLEYFSGRGLIVEHPMLTSTMDQLLNAADPGLDQNIVLLIGPTGVGKSVLLKKVNQRLLLEASTEMDENAAIIPSIYVEADAPERGNFDWREFYVSCLIELRAPLIGNTLPIVQRQAGGLVIETVAPYSGGARTPSAGTLRRRLRDTLDLRKTRLFEVDEAAHMLNVRGYRSKDQRTQAIKANINTVKSLINKSSATLVLAGAFDFFDLTLYTGQLARRSQIVYFPEYPENPEGIEGYSKGLLGLLSHIPTNHELHAEEIAVDIFYQSLANIGITRTILYRGLKKSFDTGRVFNKKLLKECFYPKEHVQIMRKEAEDGRSRVLDLLDREDFVPRLSQFQAPSSKGMADDRSDLKPKKLKPGETKPNRRWEGADSQ